MEYYPSILDGLNEFCVFSVTYENEFGEESLKNIYMLTDINMGNSMAILFDYELNKLTDWLDEDDDPCRALIKILVSTIEALGLDLTSVHKNTLKSHIQLTHLDDAYTDILFEDFDKEIIALVSHDEPRYYKLAHGYLVLKEAIVEELKEYD